MRVQKEISAFEAMLLSFIPCFTAPTYETFVAVATGWILCLGRPTIVRIVASAGEFAKKHLSTYHRFFRTARWELDDIFKVLVTRLLVPWFAPTGEIVIAGDDTTCGKTGRRVACAGYYRDAVRSTPLQKVIHWAHCWVVLSLQVRLPFWPYRVISLPIMARLYRKEADCDEAHPFRTRGQLVLEMIGKLADWLPGRVFMLLADGAYPSEELVRGLPRNVKFLSRIRSDAALYGFPPVVKKRGPGKPAQKGARLPSPKEIAATATDWVRRVVVSYGRRRVRVLYFFEALWWKVAKARRLLIVIVRDPSGKEKDDYFFTTDPEMDPARVAELFSARWGIEEVFREAKGLLGFDEVQGWKERTVERQAPIGLVLLSLVKAWYLRHIAPKERPEALPSAAQMLTRLRMAFWGRRISAMSAPRREMRKFMGLLESALRAAA